MTLDFSHINGHDRAKIARIAMVYDLPSPYSFEYWDAENAEWLDLLVSAVCDACEHASYLTDRDYWSARYLLMWFDNIPEARETLQDIITKHKAFEDEQERKEIRRRRIRQAFTI